jgi:hypothetical protein
VFPSPTPLRKFFNRHAVDALADEDLDMLGVSDIPKRCQRTRSLGRNERANAAEGAAERLPR